MTAKPSVQQGMRLIAGLVVAFLTASSARADMHYVSTNGLHLTPFTNWNMAATNITMTALWTATSDGDVVVLSNGTHVALRAVTFATWEVNKTLTITGAYGAAQTIIDGTNNNTFSVFNNSITSYINNVTISNFGAYAVRINAGGALYAENCVFSGNTNAAAGSGGSTIMITTGAKFFATNCAVRGNRKMSPGNGSAIYFGGGTAQCILDRCDLSDNIGGSGGAIYILNAAGAGAGLTARNCRIANNNISTWDGGGVVLQAGHRLENCTIVGNSGGQGGGVNMYGGEMVNCMVAYNTGTSGGGVNNAGGVMRNCTVVGNAGGNGGGINGLGTSVNSIVYFNTGNGSFSNFISQVFSNSCTAPLPAGGNNITTNPMLVNLPADCHLRRGSPCINTGLNQDWMTNAVDLDGRARIREGTVDMGAYEWLPKVTVLMIQ